MIAAAEVSTDGIAGVDATRQLRTLAASFAAPKRRIDVAPPAGSPLPAQTFMVWDFLADYALKLFGSGHGDNATRTLASVRFSRQVVEARNYWTAEGFWPTVEVLTREPRSTDSFFTMVNVLPVEVASYDQFVVEPVVERVATLSAAGEVSQALDVVFEFVESEMLQRRSARCERFLQRLRGEVLPTEVCLGVLTATRPWRRELKSRPAMLEHTRTLLLQKYEAVRVDRILRGLE
ncbi:MAG: hypothetical protein Q8P41_18250 [Pseudomonadota bacterium]|nr:hypothetical protein [Pseudomonadota bacterium]